MRRSIVSLLLTTGLVACSPTTDATTTEPPATSTTTTAATSSTTTTSPATTTTEPVTEAVFATGLAGGDITIESGGDYDYEVISAGDPERQAIQSGNGAVLASSDANTDADYYVQFTVADDFLFEAQPTSRIRIEVEYLDDGTDTFNIQYDAVAGGHSGDGRFKDTGVVVKTGTGKFRTAVFSLCDAFFGNRDNGADFRIADGNDGAEAISRVSVFLVAPTQATRTISVDSCGADPFDQTPDSLAIQACIDQACDGDVVTFTSGVDDPGYQGYIVDRTVFLARTSTRSGLAFTSTDPNNHAKLIASADLLGPVVRLYARSGIGDPGYIDDITISDIDIDGNRAERVCFGADNVGDGIADNWGSWLPECDVYDDPWCSPTTLAMDGGMGDDLLQDYLANPEQWSTGIVVRDMNLTNNECGTMLAFMGAAGTIESVTIDAAGDHVHGPGCTPIDADEPLGAWSDGITFAGPDHLITNNTIRDASDIGIVQFGGRGTIISNNTIIATPGNHGMFAGIAVHPYGHSLLSGLEVVGNTVVNEADETCGGIHTGIDIGTHMWNAGCVWDPGPAAIGQPGPCSSVSPPPGFVPCTPGQPCRAWGFVPAGERFTVADNSVTGAQVNYLIEGLDVEGELVTTGNVSTTPRPTDWYAAQGCTWDGITDSWGILEFVAHDPTISGWVDQRIYCER